MIAGTKRVAYARLPARSIIYSEDEVARGEKCGRRINVFMKNAENQSETFDYTACKVEAFLWLANVKFAAACWSAIPPGYFVDHEPSAAVFPRFLEYVQSSVIETHKILTPTLKIFLSFIKFNQNESLSGSYLLSLFSDFSTSSPHFSRPV